MLKHLLVIASTLTVAAGLGISDASARAGRGGPPGHAFGAPAFVVAPGRAYGRARCVGRPGFPHDCGLHRGWYKAKHKRGRRFR